MAERAHYLVTQPPGAPIPGVGFVKNGDAFYAPSEDFVPSKTFRAMNEPAQRALRKLRDTLKAHQAAPPPPPPKPWEVVKDEIYVPPVSVAAVQREVVSHEDLGRLDADKQPTSGKRTADR